MAWTWIRPRDPDVLEGRPLLDLGCGDGQTMAALVRPEGLVVGVDRSLSSLRAAKRSVVVPLVAAEAAALPFRDASFRVLLAGDLLHHLDETGLHTVLRELRRITAPGGRLVAWWYEETGRPAPDSPRFPRPFQEVASAAVEAGFQGASRLPLEYRLDPSPPTVGCVAEVLKNGMRAEPVPPRPVS